MEKNLLITVNLKEVEMSGQKSFGDEKKNNNSVYLWQNVEETKI